MLMLSSSVFAEGEVLTVNIEGNDVHNLYFGMYAGKVYKSSGSKVSLAVNQVENAKINISTNVSKEAYIGLTSTTVCFSRTVHIAQEFKKAFPNVKIMLGGAHVSAVPKHAMSFDCFDYGIIGEGEITTLELLQCIENNGDIDSVDGLVYKKDGNITFTNKRKLIKHLDELPFPARHLVKDIHSYVPTLCDYSTLPVTNIITSRGCPALCTFCSHAVFGITYRERSAQNIFEEIKEVITKYHIREIHFNDDTFLINKKRIYELFELCKQAKLKFSWSCFSRVNNVNYEFLKFLKQNGCWHIAFGIESGDEQVLKDIKKQISLEMASQVINWCHKLGIKTKGHFIVGHPTDTIESIDRTIKYALTTPFSDVVVTVSTPMPGSEQFDTLIKEEDHNKLDYNKFNSWLSIVEPKGISRRRVLEKQKEFYQKFYLRPSVILRYALSCISFAGPKRFVTLFMNFLYLVLSLESNEE
jgi:radical SAM superfamily enzyme YgiQ (UPF0313 family)